MGFVYVIQAIGTNRIKIGYSVSPHGRLSQLQTGSPYELKLLAQWPGTVEAERRAHQALADFRCGGEWFAVPPMIGGLIYQAVQAEPVQIKDLAPARLKPASPAPIQVLTDEEAAEMPASSVEVTGSALRPDHRLWRFETYKDKCGRYRLKAALRFASVRVSRDLGTIPEEIAKAIQGQPKRGRSRANREAADRSRRYAEYIARCARAECGNQIG